MGKEFDFEVAKKDVKFLLANFAIGPENPPKGMAPMFYATGSYHGDCELVGRVRELYDRYEIDIKDDEDD